MTHYFHYKGIVIHNSIFTIISKTMHLTDALHPIEANQVFINKLYVICDLYPKHD